MEHSTWLSFMRERLLLIREFPAEDGSIIETGTASYRLAHTKNKQAAANRESVRSFVWAMVGRPSWLLVARK